MKAIHVAHEPIPNILLRNARKQNRWTQEEVAEKIGVVTLSVGRWERGETVPGSYACYKLCGLFNKRARELGLPNGKETHADEDIHSRGSNFNGETVTSDRVLKENRLSWHHKLKRERQLRGWSQANVAERVGSDPKTVGRWERGLAFPGPYFQQKFVELFGKSVEELGLVEPERSQESGQPYRTPRAITMDLPVHCGDCEQPNITAVLDTMVIDPSRDCTMFYFRLINRTAEDVGLRFESLSLIDPSGDFFIGRSVGSFLLGTGQSIPLSVVFDWVPQQNMVYKLNIVLIRPDKWRNTYRPIPLKV